MTIKPNVASKSCVCHQDFASSQDQSVSLDQLLKDKPESTPVRSSSEEVSLLLNLRKTSLPQLSPKPSESALTTEDTTKKPT